MKRFFLILMMSAPLCAAGEEAVSSHPFSIDDMLAMQRISEPRVSPHGKHVVFVVRTTDLQENKGSTDLWLVQADGTRPRQLTSDPAGDNNPRWSPDGKQVFFISDRCGTSQVWKISLGGGKAEQVTDLPLDVGNLILSRDGKHIGLTRERVRQIEKEALEKLNEILTQED